MFRKLFNIQASLLRKIFFFLPRQLKCFFANVLAGLLLFVELFVTFISIVLVCLYFYLGTPHATATLTNLIQTGLTKVSDNSAYDLSLGKLSLEEGILVEDFVISDPHGVFLDIGKVFIDLKLPNLVFAFSKLTIDTILIEDAKYLNIPNTGPTIRTPIGVDGLLIPHGVLPFPLGEIEIKNIALRNAFVGAEGMNLEDFGINLYADADVHAVLTRDLATFDIHLREEGTEVVGTAEYRTHELKVDVKVIDSKWAQEFPKVERIEMDVQGTMNVSEFPPSAQRPLLVDLKAKADIFGIFWANEKEMNTEMELHFSYDRVLTAFENAKVTEDDFIVEVPYFAIDTWKGEFVESIAHAQVFSINSIVPAMYGTIAGDVHFSGPFRKMQLDFDMHSPKFYFGAEDFELFSFYDVTAKANTVIDVIELNQDIKWAGIGTADSHVHAKEFSFMGMKMDSSLDAKGDVILDRYLLSFNDSTVNINGASAYTPRLQLEYDHYKTGTFPKLEGDIEIHATNFDFIADHFPVQGILDSYITLKGKKVQTIDIITHVKDLLLPGLAVESINIEAQLTDTDLIMKPQMPNMTGKMTTSYLDLYDIPLNTIDNKIYNETISTFNFKGDALDLKVSTNGELESELDFIYFPLRSEIHLNSFNAKYALIDNTFKLLNSVRINFAEYFQISPFEIRIGDNQEGHINGEALFNARDFKLNAAVSLPLKSLQPYIKLKSGLLDFDLDFSGAYTNPSGQVALSIMQYEHLDELYDLTLDGQYKKEALEWNMSLGQENEPLIAEGIFPLAFKPYPSIDMKSEIKAHAEWAGNVEFLWNLLPILNRDLTGNGMFNLNILGTYEEPLITGKAYLSKGRFVDTLLDFVVSDIDAEVNLRDTNIDLKLSARDGSAVNENNKQKGIVLVNGTAKPENGSFVLDLRSAINSFSPLQRDDLRVMGSGNINIAGPIEKPLISGNIHVNEAALLLSQDITNSTSIQGLNVTYVSDVVDEIVAEESEVSVSMNPEFNIQVSIPPVVRVRGSGLNSIWQGDLLLMGSLEELLLVGTLSHAEGTYELLGKEFDFTRSAVIFSGNMTLPIYNVVVERSNEVIDTIATISGVGSDIDINLSSNPVLPVNEILARTIFAKPLADLTQFEALQVAANASMLIAPELAQFNILELTRKTLGLSVKINTSDNYNDTGDILDGVSLEVGGYLNDSIYLGVEQGAQDSALHLEIKLFSNVNANARIGTDTSQAGILWKNDY